MGKNEGIQNRSHLDKSGGLAKVSYFKVAYQTLFSVIFVVPPSDPCGVSPQFSNCQRDPGEGTPVTNS